METDDKNGYLPPALVVVEINSEQGFAQSNRAYEEGEEFGWDA